MRPLHGTNYFHIIPDSQDQDPSFFGGISQHVQLLPPLKPVQTSFPVATERRQQILRLAYLMQRKIINSFIWTQFLF